MSRRGEVRRTTAETDVHVIVVESYGRVALRHPGLAPAIASLWQELAQQAAGAGFSIVSSACEPAIAGGASWLAHAELFCALRVGDRRTWELLLASDTLALPKLFRAAGYTTIEAMPAMDRHWPEGQAFYGFDQSITQLELGYTCDTRGGSSGSPVISHATNRVVGLHHCRGAALGCADPNRAVPIQPILAQIGPLLGPVAVPGQVTGDLASKTGPSWTDLTFDWNAAPDADSYRIYRGTIGVNTPGVYDHLADTAVGIGSCSETGLSRTFVGGAAFTDGTGDFYYLIVGVAACGAEGPYGHGSNNGFSNPWVPRPAGAGCP